MRTLLTYFKNEWKIKSIPTSIQYFKLYRILAQQYVEKHTAGILLNFYVRKEKNGIAFQQSPNLIFRDITP
jgi:hypothetical protein